LGQLLWAIPNIKRYIFNLIPSKPTLLEPTVASITFDPSNGNNISSNKEEFY
jgi:hypothetical protein